MSPLTHRTADVSSPDRSPAHAPASGVYNFAAGPAAMPREVLRRARSELLDWRGSGLSVWEMPFTGPAFREILAAARDDLRAILSVPDGYRILFMHGGASAQFSLVPMNLLHGKAKAAYVETGHWSRKAIREGARYCRVQIAASAADDGFIRVPSQNEWRIDPDAGFCHITSNETANGTQYHWTPKPGNVPLVADATSEFLSRPMDLSRYGLIYAGAQKNIGPAGLTIVILREDLIGIGSEHTPSVFDYRVQADSDCMFNTPLTYAIYLAGLVFAWIKEKGGLEAMARDGLRKSGKLYAEIDANPFYHCPVRPADRSRTNVCFRLKESQLEPLFLREAGACGLINLKGHSAVGGIRASLYNAMPEDGVEALVSFMQDFARRYG